MVPLVLLTFKNPIHGFQIKVPELPLPVLRNLINPGIGTWNPVFSAAAYPGNGLLEQYFGEKNLTSLLSSLSLENNVKGVVIDLQLTFIFCIL